MRIHQNRFYADASKWITGSGAHKIVRTSMSIVHTYRSIYHRWPNASCFAGWGMTSFRRLTTVNWINYTAHSVKHDPNDYS